MTIYNLPNPNIKKIKDKILKAAKDKILIGSVFLVLAGCIIGIFMGAGAMYYFPAQVQSFIEYFIPQPVLQQNASPALQTQNQYESAISYEQAVINAAKNVSPSVVSIIISKYLPVYEQQWVNPFGNGGDPFGGMFPDFNFQIPQQVQKGTKYQEVGAGSGFIVSEDGLVLTNKHVVLDSKADYTVFTNDGQKYPAKVLALDPVQDLAVIKVEPQEGKAFQPAVFGNSDGLQIGQTAIAIGNALGQFRNTVSVGVVSGLGRTVSASNQTGSFSETLQDIIQTDAAINEGNSGGPLLNLKGEVIGINTAMAQGAQGIGFAIPINMAKSAIEQVKTTNKIVYPFLGVRYITINSQVQEERELAVDYGVLVLKGSNGEAAVTPDSAAEKAGIKEDDIILEINGQKITQDKTLASIIMKMKPNDEVSLKILRDGNETEVQATLGERTE